MFKTINDGYLPRRFTKYSCGFDVFANEDVIIRAGETKLIGLGVCIDQDSQLFKYFQSIDSLKMYYFALHIRSSLRVKGLTSLGTGVIDIDYKDEIKMIIHNPITSEMFGYRREERDAVDFGPLNYEVKQGDKIGQLVLCTHEGFILPQEYTLQTERVGGFGSTNC